MDKVRAEAKDTYLASCWCIPGLSAGDPKRLRIMQLHQGSWPIPRALEQERSFRITPIKARGLLLIKVRV